MVAGVEASAAQRLFPDKPASGYSGALSVQHAGQKGGILRRLGFGKRQQDDALLPDMDQDQLPTKDIVREEVWRLLPGDQRRRILLAKDDLAFGLEGDVVQLDRIPLHEVTGVPATAAGLHVGLACA